MDKINKLKEQLQAVLEKTDNKEMIETLGQISATINDIEADTTALEQDNRQLLNDYKEMIKHTSFKVDNPQTRTAVVEPPKLEDFLKK